MLILLLLILSVSAFSQCRFPHVYRVSCSVQSASNETNEANLPCYFAEFWLESNNILRFSSNSLPIYESRSLGCKASDFRQASTPSIVAVIRGDCPIYTKAYHAIEAGYQGLLVLDKAEPFKIDRLGFRETDDIGIPVLIASAKSHDNALKQFGSLNLQYYVNGDDHNDLLASLIQRAKKHESSMKSIKDYSSREYNTTLQSTIACLIPALTDTFSRANNQLLLSASAFLGDIYQYSKPSVPWKALVAYEKYLNYSDFDNFREEHLHVMTNLGDLLYKHYLYASDIEQQTNYKYVKSLSQQLTAKLFIEEANIALLNISSGLNMHISYAIEYDPCHFGSSCEILQKQSSSPFWLSDKDRIFDVKNEILTSTGWYTVEDYVISHRDVFVLGSAGVIVSYSINAETIQLVFHVNQGGLLVPFHSLLNIDMNEFVHKLLNRINNNNRVLDSNVETCVAKSTVILNVLQMSTNNYFHFLTQYVSRAVSLIQTLTQQSIVESNQSTHNIEVVLLVPKQVKEGSMFHNLLQYFGINEGQHYVATDMFRQFLLDRHLINDIKDSIFVTTKFEIFDYSKSNDYSTVLTFDWSVFDHQASKVNYGLEFVVPPNIIKTLSQSNKSLSNQHNFRYLVFISRMPKHSNSASSARFQARHIRNERELLRALKRLAIAKNLSISVFHSDNECQDYFVNPLVSANHPSPCHCQYDCTQAKRTIQLFHNAHIVLGVHGAGLANILFSTKLNALIEISFENTRLRDYQYIAQSMDVKYLNITLPRETSFDDSIEIDIETTINVVESAL